MVVAAQETRILECNPHIQRCAKIKAVRFYQVGQVLCVVLGLKFSAKYRVVVFEDIVAVGGYGH